MTNTHFELPLHLRQYLAEQDYSLYTPIDHASWRYIMRVSEEFFKTHAHPKYVDGLRETGVTIDRIPRISEMDEKLRKFGWRAVVITGFIPPEPFLEMLAHRILPIAADMRKLENLDYTPAPDIVHEAAGHAPILADPDYSSYLKKFGEIARRVIYAKEDNLLYEAVLNLSETKEDPASTSEDIAKAQQQLEEAVKQVGYVSEAQMVTRLGWWSTEYGLFHKDGRYLIYGAGLLSSVGESYNCLSDEIKKVTLTVDCVDTAYDITKPQPQLFVTDDFKKLELVIDQLASRMAYKLGGKEALEKAKRAQTLTTTTMDSGIQVSGILNDFQIDAQGNVCFIKFSGPSQISIEEKQLEGHGADYHTEGFSSPVGKIKGLERAPWKASDEEWRRIGCELGKVCHLEFHSGIILDGKLVSRTQHGSNTLVMSFESCTVKQGSQILFDPAWGTFDMILGDAVVSVFGGAADREAYARKVTMREFRPRKQKCNLTTENRELALLYGVVRELREAGEMGDRGLAQLERVASQLDEKYPDDWLLRLEMLELLNKRFSDTKLFQSLSNRLQLISTQSKKLKMLIDRGLALNH